MAIRESGIRLRVDGLSQFTADINRANQAANNFGSGAKSFQLGNGDPFAAFAGSADRSLGTVQAKFGALNSFTAGIFAGLGGALATSLISGATKAATAIPNLLKSAFSEAINLEQASADAFAISQPSAQQQAQLAKIAESAALNPNLQVSQAGALEAIDAALKANISAQQIAGGGIIEAIVSQQNALGGSFNDNARLIAKQLNDQAGVANQLSAQQLANQNVGTFRAGQFQSINDLLLAQAASGGALKNLGVSQQQFNEFLAVAGTTASGGSDAGTSVKAFINASANASKEQAEAQAALGFNIANSQGEFNNALALSQQLSAARLNGINAIIETGGGTKEQQAELKRLNRAIASNLNSASNLEAGITGVNLSDEKRAAKIAQANAQAQAAKKQFDAMLGTIPALGQTATKIKQSETEFAGLLFQAFGTDGGRFAAALAGLSEEEARNVEAMISGADALEVAAVKTNTVQSKLESIGDIFTANISKIAKPSLAPLKDALASVAKLGGAIAPAFDVAGQVLFRVVSGPLTGFSQVLNNISLGIENFSSGFSRSISLSDIFDIGTGGFDITLSKDIINGGNKISLTFGDIFTFETGAGGTLLKLGDFFSFDTTNDKLKISVKDLINFSYDSEEDGTKINLNDFFTVDTTDNQIRINLGDLIEFDTGTLGESSLSQLRIGQTITNFIYGQGKVALNIGRMLYFDFNLSNFGGFATLDIGAFGRSLVSAFYKQGQIKIDVGRLLNISGGVTPSGAFTLALNDRNFTIDPSAVISGLQSAFTRLRAAFDGIKAGYDVAGIEGALLVAGSLVRNAFSKLAGAVQSISLPDIASSIKQKLQSQFSAFVVAVPDLASSIKQKLTAQFAVFDISIPDVISGIRSRLSAQFANFSISVPDIASSIKTRLQAQFAAFDISLPDIAGAVKQKIEGAFATGQNAFGNATGFSLDFSGFTTAINDFKNSLGGLAGFVPGLAGFAGALTVISAVKTEGLAGIGKNVSSLVSGLGLLSNPISALAAIPYVGTALGLATVVGAISVLNTIDTSKFTQISTDLSGAVTGIIDFGTKLVEGFNAESFAGTANSFVTGFVDRISATISGVDTGAIATSALGFATSILNKLSAVFSDPSLGADIGASAAGLVGSLVNSLSGVFSDPQAFANFGEGAASLTLSIGGFVTSLVTSFGSELTKVDFGQLIENGALSFAGLATGISKAISDSLIDGIDEMLGTKLASPQQRFEAFIDAIIGAVNKLPGVGALVTTAEEAQAEAAAKAAGKNTGFDFLSLPNLATATTKAIVNPQPVTTTQPAEPPKTWTQTIQDAALGFAGTLANVAVNNLSSLPLPVATGGGNGLGFAGVGIVRLDAGKVEVQGQTTKTPSGEPQAVFNQAAAVQEVIRRATQGQPVQGPITQAQSIAQNAQPVGGGSSLFGTQQQAAQPKATAAAPTGGGSGFLAPSLKSADAQLQQGVSTFSAALKAAGSSVRATTAGVKIPPFKWPVIAPFNLASKVSNYRWPESKGVDLSNYITPFPGWSAIVPFVNVPVIPPFPGWQAFVQTVTVQVPSTGGSGSTGGGSSAPDPGTGSGPRSGNRTQAAKSTTAQKAGIDTQPIVESYQDGTDALIKTLEDMADTGKTTNVRNYNINIYSVNGTSDILKTLLTGNNVEKQVALLNSGASTTGATTPNYTDKNAILSLFTGGTGAISDPFGGRSSAPNKGATNDSPQVAALLQAPPQVTNNYYNTKNYNLSVYTYQSEASITDQFAYMEHLGAGL